MKYVSALRSRRHGHREVTRYSRHTHLAAEHELWIRHQHFGVEILAVPLEARIVGDLEEHMDVTARTAARARIADAAQRHVLACGNASGNLHGHVALTAQTSFAAAFLA